MRKKGKKSGVFFTLRQPNFYTYTYIFAVCIYIYILHLHVSCEYECLGMCKFIYIIYL
jgi:hypothetical protein